MNSDTIRIVLNGTPLDLPHGEYSYEQLYNLAFPGQPVPTGKEVPITYSVLHGHESGKLLPGEKLELKKEMVINVRANYKS
jgi:hypothetical protein